MKFSFMHIHREGDVLYGTGCFIIKKNNEEDIAAFNELKQEIKEINDGCLKSAKIVEKNNTIYFSRVNLKALCQTLEYWRTCLPINLVYSANKRIVYSGGATKEDFEAVLKNNNITLIG